MRFVAALFFLLLTGQTSAATLLGEYRLEELLWTGAAAEVRDSSGNSRHGHAIGSPLPAPVSTSPARPGRPGTCTYGSFPGPAGNGGALSVGGLPVNTTGGAQPACRSGCTGTVPTSVMPIGWNLHDLWLFGGFFRLQYRQRGCFGIASAGLANGSGRGGSVTQQQRRGERAVYRRGGTGADATTEHAE